MSGTQQDGSEQELLGDVGETAGAARRAGEGGGGAEGEESFTMGGPRGRDAERGEYHETAARGGEDDDADGDGGQ